MPAFSAALATPLLFPASPGWDEARKAWDLAVDQHPAAIALPESVADVAAAVGFARRHGLRVATQGTGHNAAPLGPLGDTVLVKTHRMRQVRIDPDARTARAQAGAVWADVVGPAAGHGLAALAGSSPDVGVVGYTLGGGMGWLGRAYGLSASNVESFEAVTADGRLVRADACTEPDLFWALRGGGSFAVVTAVELRLFGVTEVYAGLLWWPIDAAASVLHAWQELTAGGLPDELTTTFRFLRFPDVPDVPEPVRGRAFAVVDAIHLGTPAEADALLAPLRKLRPVTDTVQMISMPALSHLHMDPEHPVPGVGDGIMLADQPAEAVTRLLGAAGPGTGSPLGVELRHVGGEMKRARPGNGALAAVDAEYALFAAAAAPTPQAVPAIGHQVAAVLSAMSPWAAAQTYLNLTETSRDPATFWTPQAYDRLRRIKAAVDPADLIRANHPIPPAPLEQATPPARDRAVLQPAG